MEYDLNCYTIAGKALTSAFKTFIEKIKPGMKISDMCLIGDSIIRDELTKVYKKTDNKGLSFPTSIGIDEIAGYYCGDRIIPDNCLLHIEMGCHIDGYPTKCCKTVIIGEVSETDKNLVECARKIGEETLKTFIENKTNFKTQKIMKKITDENDFKLPYVIDPDYKTPGLFSYQMSRNNLDGLNDDDVPEDMVHKMIIHRDHLDYDFTSQESDYEQNEVYCVDILICSGDDKLYPTDDKVYFFKRDYDKRYDLKLKSSRECITNFKDSFVKNTYNFSPKLQMGIKECVSNELLVPYGTFKVKNGKISRFQYTVIVGKKKPVLLTEIF